MEQGPLFSPPEEEERCSLTLGLYGSLAGSPQTTPRAALTAFIVALALTAGS